MNTDLLTRRLLAASDIAAGNCLPEWDKHVPFHMYHFIPDAERLARIFASATAPIFSRRGRDLRGAHDVEDE
jgi:hypothetical protein